MSTSSGQSLYLSSTVSQEAIAAFKRYLELAPEAPDREGIEEQIRDLAFWLASRN